MMLSSELKNTTYNKWRREDTWYAEKWQCIAEKIFLVFGAVAATKAPDTPKKGLDRHIFKYGSVEANQAALLMMLKAFTHLLCIFLLPIRP